VKLASVQENGAISRKSGRSRHWEPPRSGAGTKKKELNSQEASPHQEESSRKGKGKLQSRRPWRERAEPSPAWSRPEKRGQRLAVNH